MATLMTLKEWKKVCNELSKEELKKYVSSINTLLRWPVFKREYKWTQLSIIRDILKFELRGRV